MPVSVRHVCFLFIYLVLYTPGYAVLPYPFIELIQKQGYDYTYYILKRYRKLVMCNIIPSIGIAQYQAASIEKLQLNIYN